MADFTGFTVFLLCDMHTYFTVFIFTCRTFSVAYKRVKTLKLLEYFVVVIVCFLIFIFVIKIARVSVHTFQYSRKCSCRTSSSSLIGGSGAGWEGTALLNHGSYIKFGCLQFVFSITDFASAAAVAATEATALGSSSAKNQASTESIETCASTSSTVKQTPDGEQPT